MKSIVEKWDNLFKNPDYAFGTTPNVYFKLILEKYNPTGKILLAGEGEGRNAVFAATKGLSVFAFDISKEGKKKAMRLAKDKKVSLIYDIGDFIKMQYIENSFDVAALIYTHFHPNIRSIYHQKIISLVKQNGLIILEGFSVKNPSLIDQNKMVDRDVCDKFYTLDKIKKDFSNFEILELEEIKTELKEGIHHNGKATVIRFVGKKRK